MNAVCILILLLAGVVMAEIHDSESKNKVPIVEDDVKEAKERWMSMEEEWGDMGDMQQHPIDEGLRRVDRELGDICTYSRDCSSGCCLLERSTKIRSCQPKSLRGEKCSNAQVKADTYVDNCPCVAGYDFCTFPGEVCNK